MMHTRTNFRPQNRQHRQPRSTANLLLLRGVSLVSVLAALGGGVAFAQSADSAMEAAPVEAVPSPEAPANPAPASTSPEVVPSLPERSPAAIEAAPEMTTAPAPVMPDDSYIDSTHYSLGATERTSERNRVAAQSLPATAPTSVQIGPISVGSYGLGLSQTTPSIRDYYNRMIRPIGRLGNGNIKLIFPLSIPAPISSIFGWRIHPITGEQRFHSGTDLAAPLGTPVLAAYAGRVAIADFLGGYGLAVALEHNKGTQQTLYGHLSEIFVKPGELIQQGMVIGRVGSTGLSTGPHLHFEFRQLTPDGWVAMDAGTQLEYALAQLVKSLNFAQAKPEELGLKPEAKLGAINLGIQGGTKQAALAPTTTDGE